jgi:hypothetical protein
MREELDDGISTGDILLEVDRQVQESVATSEAMFAQELNQHISCEPAGDASHHYRRKIFGRQLCDLLGG